MVVIVGCFVVVVVAFVVFVVVVIVALLLLLLLERHTVQYQGSIITSIPLLYNLHGSLETGPSLYPYCFSELSSLEETGVA